jgi:antitoxin component of MazEF toxin-antitoxin module
MIRTKARQQGGAVIITIPAGVLKLRQIKAGDRLDIDLTPDGFVVRKIEVPVAYSANPAQWSVSLMVSGSQAQIGLK